MEYSSKHQIKGRCLNEFYHQHVGFIYWWNCDTLACNADAFRGLWHSEKEKDREEMSKRDLRTWPLILSKERSQA